MSTSETTIEACRVFLCYRQVDGAEQAEWLHEHLHGRELPDIASGDSEPSRLDVYFDQTAPAVDSIGITREESARSFERNIAPHVADIRVLVGRELTPSERLRYPCDGYDPHRNCLGHAG